MKPLPRALSRPGPYGVLGVRTLMPRTAADRAHRTIAAVAFGGHRRSTAWSLQFVLWLKWIGWSSWRSGWRIGRRRRRGPRPIGALGLGRLWYRAAVHGVPPTDAVRLDLVDAPIDEVLAHVFRPETSAFHLACSHRSAPSAGERALADKHAGAVRMSAHQIPVAPTLVYWRQGTRVTELPTSPSGLICKPNDAAASRDIVRIRPDDIAAHRVDGTPMGADALDIVNRTLERCDVLAQPYLETHPAVVHLGRASDEALVVRTITRMIDGTPSLWIAYAEVPVERDGAPGYALARVVDGTLSAPPSGDTHDIAGADIPDWERLVDSACRAHRIEPFSAVHAIAWDIAVTDGGPVVLEGNSGWNVAPVQRFLGPLLADPTVLSRLGVDRPTRSRGSRRVRRGR